jgi:hypothetical protein
MSYIGVIHRKDTDTGVTARAKIVTPDKKKAVSHNYKITVKAKKKSVFEQVVEDVISTMNAVKGVITDFEDVSYDLTQLKAFVKGKNGSTIEITMSGDAASCFTNDFSFIQAPGVGSDNVSGTIRVRGEMYDEAFNKTESWYQEQEFTVKAASEEDLFDEFITAQWVWDNIITKSRTDSRVSNGLRTYADRGYDFVNRDINLPTVIVKGATATGSQKYTDRTGKCINDAIAGSNNLNVQWELTDSVAEQYNNISGRLGVAGDSNHPLGVINDAKRLSYSVMNGMYVDSPATGIRPWNDENISSGYCFTIPGITLTGTFYFGQLSENRKRTVSFNLTTISQYLTNTEVSDFVKSSNDFKVSGYLDGTETVVNSAMFNGGTAVEFVYDANGYISVVRSQDSGIFDESQLFNRIVPRFFVEYSIFDQGAGTSQTTVADYVTSVFGKTAMDDVFYMPDAGAGTWKCNIKVAGLDATTALAVKIQARISCTSYSVGGLLSPVEETASGATATNTVDVYANVNFKKAAAA